jgi:AcrR family transcriptional regulator
VARPKRAPAAGAQIHFTQALDGLPAVTTGTHRSLSLERRDRVGGGMLLRSDRPSRHCHSCPVGPASGTGELDPRLPPILGDSSFGISPSGSVTGSIDRPSSTTTWLMPRPQVHPTDTMLDAARDLLLEEGARGATVEAIAEVSGAPTGSIYNRFGSRDELFARLWVRAVYRSQASFLAALERDDPREAVLACAMSVIDFCKEHPEDARLLTTFRREDLMTAVPKGELADELATLNDPLLRAVEELAQRLYGTRARIALDRTLCVVFDLPYGAVRRYLIAGVDLPSGLRRDLELAVAAVLDAPLRHTTRRPARSRST